ncbi:WXG100 family type VII secretion target [Kitasatospora fiedleri]|uniref:WXG100 family type VII secretion target n=1 Tax=Kitasatospora fiedleri TaxID=2991545 RepID=UPI00249AB84C|nr:WXG100 family type VII secretion target [Kitasatospora fiedleri]
MAETTPFDSYALIPLKNMVSGSSPERIKEVGQHWQNVHEELTQAATDLRAAIEHATANWTGAASQGFATKGSQIQEGMVNTAAHAQNTSVAMTYAASALEQTKSTMDQIKVPSFMDRVGKTLSDGFASSDEGFKRDLASGMNRIDAVNKNAHDLSATEVAHQYAIGVMEHLGPQYTQAAAYMDGGQPSISEPGQKFPPDPPVAVVPPGHTPPSMPNPKYPGGVPPQQTTPPNVSPGLPSVPQPTQPGHPVVPVVPPVGSVPPGGDLPPFTPPTFTPTPVPPSTGILGVDPPSVGLTPPGSAGGLPGGVGTLPGGGSAGGGTGGGGYVPGGLGGGYLPGGGLGGGGRVSTGGLSGAGGAGGGRAGGSGTAGGAGRGTAGGAAGSGAGGSGSGAAGARGAAGAGGMGGMHGGGAGGARGGAAGGKSAAGGLVRKAGGTVGGAKAAGAGGRAFTEGGSGIGKGRAGQAGAAGMHGGSGSGGSKKKNQGHRPDYLVEDEDTWRGGEANPGVIE